MQSNQYGQAGPVYAPPSADTWPAPFPPSDSWPARVGTGLPPQYGRHNPTATGYQVPPPFPGPRQAPNSYGQYNGRYPANYVPIPNNPYQAPYRHGAYQAGNSANPYEAAANPYQPMYPVPSHDPFGAPDYYGYGSVYANQIAPNQLAEPGARLGAYILDCIALAVPLFVVAGMAAVTASETLASMALLLSFFGPALYFVTCWANGGQTLGYRALGLRLVRTDGSRPGAGSAIARCIGVALCVFMFVPGALGMLWMLWDDRRQGWHDKMGDTVVVKT